MGQILNISVKKLLPKVTLLSAGETQQVICTPMVYLSATIEGDLTRHTTEWEQLTGTPLVTITPVDATNAYYDIMGPAGSDKVFRFWIDKGRSYAQYSDVTIRTTPTDEIANQINATAAEITELAKIASAAVKAKFGIELQPEVNLVGITW